MEEDWRYWVDQISLVLLEENADKTIDALDAITPKGGSIPFPDTHERVSCGPQRTSPRYVRIPLPKRTQADARKMENLKIKVNLQFPSYIKTPRLIPRTDFMERYRLRRPSFVNCESPKLHQNPEPAIPVAPIFEALPELELFPGSLASFSPQRLTSPAFSHDLPIGALCLQGNLVPLPEFPKTIIWNINPVLGLPNALPMSIRNPIPIIDRKSVLPRVQLGIALERPKFPKALHPKWQPVRQLEPPPPVTPPKPPNEVLPSCTGKEPTSPPGLTDIQVIVNRELLGLKTIMSWLELCPSSRIIERDFCANLPVIAVSPGECILIVDDEKRAPATFDDLLFETIHVVVAATAISSSQIRRINLALALCDKSKIMVTIMEDPLAVIYQRIKANQVENTTQSVVLDPDLSAHERLLVSLMRTNHWKAQICLQTKPNFLHQMLQRPA